MAVPSDARGSRTAKIAPCGKFALARIRPPCASKSARGLSGGGECRLSRDALDPRQACRVFTAHRSVRRDRPCRLCRADRSGHRAALPGSPVVALALAAARRARARLAGVPRRDRPGPGSERTLAENPRPSANDRVRVPRLADSCVFRQARIAPGVFPQFQGTFGAASHVDV